MDFWCVQKWNDEIYFYFCHITPKVPAHLSIYFSSSLLFSSIWMNVWKWMPADGTETNDRVCSREIHRNLWKRRGKPKQKKKNRNKALWSTCKTFTKWILSIWLNWFSLLRVAAVFIVFLFFSCYRFYFEDGSDLDCYLCWFVLLRLSEGCENETSNERRILYVTVTDGKQKKPQKCELISLSCSLRALKAI